MKLKESPMDKQELIKLCDEFDPAMKGQFAKIVTGALENGVPARGVADTFQIAESTVMRWKSGSARPHPRMQDLVVKEIKNILG